MAVNVESLTNQVYDLIWEKIMNHEFKPGDQIPTKQIAEDNKISVMPVRLALQQLTDHGIVIKKERVGFYVATFTLRDLIEISHVRKMFELYCLSKYFNNLDLRLAQKIYDRISTSDRYEATQYRKLDTELHNLFITASDNSFLIKQYEQVKDVFALCIYFDRNNTISHSKSKIEHIIMLQHILNNEKDKAIDALQMHLERVENNIIDG